MTGRLARIVGPTLLVVVTAAVVGWMPARQAEHAALERIDAAERLVDDLAWELEELDLLDTDEATLAEEWETLAALIPDDHQLAEVILILESLATETGTELIEVVPASILGPFDDLRTPIGTSSVVIAVAMRGTYPQLLDLVERVDDQRRLLTLDAVAVGIDESADDLVIDLEIRVFTTRELIVSDSYDNGFEDDGLADDEEKR